MFTDLCQIKGSGSLVAGYDGADAIKFFSYGNEGKKLASFRLRSLVHVMPDGNEIYENTDCTVFNQGLVTLLERGHLKVGTNVSFIGNKSGDSFEGKAGKVYVDKCIIQHMRILSDAYVQQGEQAPAPTRQHIQSVKYCGEGQLFDDPIVRTLNNDKGTKVATLDVVSTVAISRDADKKKSYESVRISAFDPKVVAMVEDGTIKKGTALIYEATKRTRKDQNTGKVYVGGVIGEGACELFVQQNSHHAYASANKQAPQQQAPSGVNEHNPGLVNAPQAQGNNGLAPDFGLPDNDIPF